MRKLGLAVLTAVAALTIAPAGATECSGDVCYQECYSTPYGPLCSPVTCLGNQENGFCNCEVTIKDSPYGEVRRCTTDQNCALGCGGNGGFPRPLAGPVIELEDHDARDTVSIPYTAELRAGLRGLDAQLAWLVWSGRGLNSFVVGERQVLGPQREIEGATLPDGTPAWTEARRGRVVVERLGRTPDGVSLFGEFENGDTVAGEIWDGGRRGYLTSTVDGVQAVTEW